MAKIGLNTKTYMEQFRMVMLPELVKNIEKHFPKASLDNICTEAIQEVFHATTIAAVEDYLTFAMERIIEDNNNKIYEDLVRLGVIKEEEKEEN
ncbi:MAG TPA: hypothetical protein PL110_06910 [Candidatus Eremiobacteraeota bacterium]|nr:MAG: hypothetical protein BWY64_00396 [bacterium ADurb.Bin363]HPZ07824.1 hypothetical protein [Candidatus Eremiobacteraeota bacterium]